MLVPTAFRSYFSGSPNSRRRPSGGRRRNMLMAGAVVIGSLGGTALLAQPASAAGATFYISPTGSDAAVCSLAAPCATLAHALSIDAASDTIMVQPGTYDIPAGTSATVPPALAGTVGSPTIIESVGGAGVTAFVSTGGVNGLVVNASNVVVQGLTFDSFGAAGIQVSPPTSATAPATVSGETIENNVINNSDQCVNTPSTTACTAAIGAGDYGESMWLMSVSNSTIEGNTLEGGLGGGMLISDEVGPNHGNLVEGNNVSNNSTFGCGITLAGHNMNAVFSTGPMAGQPDPTAGGVYSNTIEDNTSDGNGATGIGLFNFAYNNTIEGNTTTGNEEPGIELDSTFLGADLSGNTITGNTVGVNSISDGPGGDSAGQHTIHATQTSGIMVIAKVTPVTGTVISNNTVTGDYYGIWMSALAASATLSTNHITVAKGGLAVFVSPAPGSGYWELGSDGGVFAFGKAPYEGSTGNLKLVQPVVAMAATPDAGGYWLVAKDGGIFSFGDAKYYGSLPALHVNVSDIVGITASTDGGGYTLVAKDGGIFSFGDAKYYGSLPGLHVSVSNIVGIAATTDGGGYWLVGSDGGLFGFGDAKYFGSLPGLHIHVSNIVNLAGSQDSLGYWQVGSDGGLFGFGDAGYFGSLPGLHIHVSNIVGVVPTP